MPMENRAGQFASFACLTGHAEQIDEKSRLTDDLVEFTEDRISELSWKIKYIEDNLQNSLEAVFVCFVPDRRKSGGAYMTLSGSVRLVDEYNRKIIFTNGDEITIDNVVEIQQIKLLA